MDDRATTRAADAFLCPGETRSIDRAAHLARLATFYPPCRNCAHRDDARGLTSLVREQWDEVQAHTCAEPQFGAESLAGTTRTIERSVARRLAAALAQVVWRQHSGAQPPLVLVGSSGHWSTAELVAGACEAIELAGCQAVEIGAVTSASLAAAAGRLTADAGLRIGDATGEPHAMNLKLWGRGGLPWSAPGDLDAVRAAYASRADRPRRRGGGLRRADATTEYLAPLAGLFHGLRPLRFVLDTTCEPLARYFAALNVDSACEVLSPAETGCSKLPAALRAEAEQRFVGRRLQLIGSGVVASQAHFGLWIDGDGESCRLVDERGAAVESERLFLALACLVCRQQPAATLVVERQASRELTGALSARAARTLASEATRQAMSEAFATSGALFGGGPSGRFWYSLRPPAPDALQTLCLLLTMLSATDQPLSEVLDAA